MSSREVSCDDQPVGVLRWLRPNVELAAGAMVPFLVAMSDVQFVRDNQHHPWVLRTGKQVWALEIVTVESTGTEGVWVSARAVSRILVPEPVDGVEADIRDTLPGLPVPGADEDF